MKISRKIFSSALLLLMTAFAYGQDFAAMEKRLYEDVKTLSDSLLAGRAIGTPGGADAAFYLIRSFQEMGLNVRAEAFTAGERIGHNIIAEVNTDATGSRYTLVCAYYDGLGQLGGKTYFGADSNASGVAGMLELARLLKTSGKNFIFAALDGHNASLGGAVALEKSLRNRKPAMVVNLDIIGSNLAPVDKYWKEFVMILGGERYASSIEKCNQGLGLHIYYDYYRSRDFTNLFYRKIGDQKVFLEKGIPALMVTSGITMSTNKEEDTAGTLNYPLFAKRIELIARWLSR